MKRLVFSATLAGALLLSVLPGRSFAQSDDGPRSSKNWSGFYAGGSLNHGKLSNDLSVFSDGRFNIPPTNILPVPFPPPNFVPIFGSFREVDDQAFGAGVHVGFNRQWNNIVLGVEAGADFLNLRDSNDIIPCEAQVFGGSIILGVCQPETRDAHRIELDHIITAGARLGHAFDNMLLYAAGGYAVGNASITLDHASDPLTVRPLVTTSRETWNVDGYYWGGGVDYAITDKLTVGLVYNRVTLGGFDRNFTSAAGRLVDVDDLDVDLVKLRVSIKF